MKKKNCALNAIIPIIICTISVLFTCGIVSVFANTELKTAKSNHVKARLGFIQMAANGIGDTEAADISKTLFNLLSDLMGADKLIYRASGLDRRSANRLLTGRISKLGSTYIVAITIVHAETGRVLYTKSVSVKDAGMIKKELEPVAREISAVKAIWE
jgi:hypothetical protein